MRKYMIVSILLTGVFTAQSYANPGNCCYEPPFGKGAEYVTQEYVDSKIAELNSRLDSIESRIAKLKSDLAGINLSSAPAGLAEKIAALENAVADLGRTCPAECSSRITRIEKDLAELKDKIGKRSKYLESEIEKSMRK